MHIVCEQLHESTLMLCKAISPHQACAHIRVRAWRSRQNDKPTTSPGTEVSQPCRARTNSFSASNRC